MGWFSKKCRSDYCENNACVCYDCGVFYAKELQRRNNISSAPNSGLTDKGISINEVAPDLSPSEEARHVLWLLDKFDVDDFKLAVLSGVVTLDCSLTFKGCLIFEYNFITPYCSAEQIKIDYETIRSVYDKKREEKARKEREQVLDELVMAQLAKRKKVK